MEQRLRRSIQTKHIYTTAHILPAMNTDTQNAILQLYVCKYPHILLVNLDFHDDKQWKEF